MGHKSILILSSLFLVVLAANGYAENGVNGVSGSPVTIIANNTPQSFKSTGGVGGNGYPGGNGDGGSCVATGGDGNVSEPSGQDGGDGGAGGAGGNGGDITVYFTDLAQISNLTVIDTPGPGGYGGAGGYGGSGCQCGIYSWPSSDGSTTYYCTDGSDGSNGSTGPNGPTGNYGNIYLVNGDGSTPVKPSIPSVYLDMAKMSEGPITLSQNVWAQNNGAKALFSAGSDISDNYYFYEGRIETTVTFKWQASRPVTDFAGSQMLVALKGNDIEVTFPQGLEVQSQVTTDGSSTTYTISDAVMANQVANLALGTVTGNGTALSVHVTDNAQVSDEVQSTVALTYYVYENGGYTIQFQGAIPASALTVTAAGFDVAIGTLGINASYLAPGLNIYIALDITRTIGTDSQKVSLANYFTTAPFAVGSVLQVIADANLYSGTTVVGSVKKGDQYKLVTTQGQWASLQTLDGTAVKGWLQISDLELPPS